MSKGRKENLRNLHNKYFYDILNNNEKLNIERANEPH